MPLPVVVHIDERQRRLLVQLVDLGQPFCQLFITIRIVLPFPGFVVPPPFFIVVNANNKQRSKDQLPRAKAEPSVCDRHDDLAAHDPPREETS